MRNECIFLDSIQKEVSILYTKYYIYFANNAKNLAMTFLLIVRGS